MIDRIKNLEPKKVAKRLVWIWTVIYILIFPLVCVLSYILLYIASIGKSYDMYMYAFGNLLIIPLSIFFIWYGLFKKECTKWYYYSLPLAGIIVGYSFLALIFLAYYLAYYIPFSF